MSLNAVNDALKKVVSDIYEIIWAMETRLKSLEKRFPGEALPEHRVNPNNEMMEEKT